MQVVFNPSGKSVVAKIVMLFLLCTSRISPLLPVVLSRLVDVLRLYGNGSSGNLCGYIRSQLGIQCGSGYFDTRTVDK